MEYFIIGLIMFCVGGCAGFVFALVLGGMNKNKRWDDPKEGMNEFQNRP
jgi:hypothetical protein